MSISMDGSSVLVNGGSSGYEPALKARYAVEVTRGPSGIGFLTYGDFNFAVQTFNPGAKVVEVGTMNIQNRQIRYPLKKGAHPDVVMGLMIFGGNHNQAYSYFWNWFTNVYNDDTDEVGVIGPDATNGCDGDLKVQVLGPDGSVMAEVDMYCCWPCKFDIGDLDRKADPDAVIATVSMVCNGWNWTYYP